MRSLSAEASTNCHVRHTAIPSSLAGGKWDEVGCVCWSAKSGLAVSMPCY